MKEKQDFIPRFFYKKYVEKGVGRKSDSNSPRKDGSQPLHSFAPNQNHNKDFNSSKELGVEDSRNYMGPGSLDTSENINNNKSSFQIRKKKNTTLKSK